MKLKQLATSRMLTTHMHVACDYEF